MKTKQTKHKCTKICYDDGYEDGLATGKNIGQNRIIKIIRKWWQSDYPENLSDIKLINKIRGRK